MGILFLLKLVATPARIMINGIVQGDVNPKSTTTEAPINIHRVMALFTAFLNSKKVALKIKAIDIGFK